MLCLTLPSCAPVAKKKEEAEKPQVLVFKRNSYMIDMCDPENMPRFPYRPKLSSKELSILSEKEMDEKIRQHIVALEAHIDLLENVIVKTRQRVELCR